MTITLCSQKDRHYSEIRAREVVKKGYNDNAYGYHVKVTSIDGKRCIIQAKVTRCGVGALKIMNISTTF